LICDAGNRLGAFSLTFCSVGHPSHARRPNARLLPTRRANLSPRVAEALRTAGFEAIHVVDLGLVTVSDDEIFDRAAAGGLTVVTADSDFGMLLALRQATSPSVVHLRHVAELTPEDHVALLGANLPQIADDHDRGAIVSLSPTRLALRDLPIC
jgi:predicted nuclease of predicted toxin-antitoxin system